MCLVTECVAGRGFATDIVSASKLDAVGDCCFDKNHRRIILSYSGSQIFSGRVSNGLFPIFTTHTYCIYNNSRMAGKIWFLPMEAKKN